MSNPWCPGDDRGARVRQQDALRQDREHVRWKGRAVTQLQPTDDRFCLWAGADTERFSEGCLGLRHHCHDNHPCRRRVRCRVSFTKGTQAHHLLLWVLNNRVLVPRHHTSPPSALIRDAVTTCHNLAGNPPSLPPKPHQYKPNCKGR